ncbi:hypothetical protein BBBOND_0309040 [Babesia bigemina]|uniref:Uncharacterized protein n=1 Tax=Babesia bigemina TaxID=5866 RepID=A0A061D8G6_BABBI|nr:hypothetical protein BBBOND_0309040 [Babesia bigemina]CDR97001.1 hypothetical protein BBBOND_0309040 [Babesia bigemina]|eukprot:XP_012769187.1 hypothetical protein BBBOND_0309040 [Babesia bigemina]
MFPARPDPFVLEEASIAALACSGRTLSADESLEVTPRSAESSPKVARKHADVGGNEEASPTQERLVEEPIPESDDERKDKYDDKFDDRNDDRNDDKNDDRSEDKYDDKNDDRSEDKYDDKNDDRRDDKYEDKLAPKEPVLADPHKETEADNWLDYVVDAAKGRVKRKPGTSASDQSGSALDLSKGGLVKVAKVAKRDEVATQSSDGGRLWRDRLKLRQQMLSEEDLDKPLPTRQQRMAGSDEVQRK